MYLGTIHHPNYVCLSLDTDKTIRKYDVPLQVHLVVVVVLVVVPQNTLIFSKILDFHSRVPRYNCAQFIFLIMSVCLSTQTKQFVNVMCLFSCCCASCCCTSKYSDLLQNTCLPLNDGTNKLRNKYWKNKHRSLHLGYILSPPASLKWPHTRKTESVWPEWATF